MLDISHFVCFYVKFMRVLALNSQNRLLQPTKVKSNCHNRWLKPGDSFNKRKPKSNNPKGLLQQTEVKSNYRSKWLESGHSFNKPMPKSNNPNGLLRQTEVKSNFHNWWLRLPYHSWWHSKGMILRGSGRSRNIIWPALVELTLRTRIRPTATQMRANGNVCQLVKQLLRKYRVLEMPYFS